MESLHSKFSTDLASEASFCSFAAVHWGREVACGLLDNTFGDLTATTRLHEEGGEADDGLARAKSSSANT